MENIGKELVSYFIVNKDLNMSKGKIAAQVAHVATIIALKQPVSLNNMRIEDFFKWYEKDQKKIVLEAHEKDLLKLVDMGIFYHIRDNGLTEIPKDSLTCVGLGVMSREEAKPYIKRFQLCK